MKKITVFLVVIGTFLLATDAPTVMAQESGGLKISPSLELSVTRVFESTDGQFNFKNFEVEAARAGNYYTEFWLLPARYANGNYTTFTVYVNGDRVGKITPATGNWQSARIEGKETLELREGKNVISISTAVPEIPAVETLKIAANDLDACISSEAYHEYLEDAEFGMSNEISEEEVFNSYSNRIVGGGNEEVFHNVPLKYTFYKILGFSEGQDITVSSSSPIAHDIDVVYYGSEPNPIDPIIGPIGPIGPFSAANNALMEESSNSSFGGTVKEFSYTKPTSAEMQGYGWLAPSEESLSNSSVQKAIAKVKIPKTGRYMIRVSSRHNGSTSVADVNVNGTYFYDNVPITRSYRSFTIPADTIEYTVITQCNTPGNDDPYLFIHGADCDRVVGFNDDAPSEKRQQYGLSNWDSCVSQIYTVKTSGASVSNYTSSNPTSYCRIVRVNTNNSQFVSKAKTRNIDKTSVCNLSDVDKSIIISGGNNLDDSISIVANEKIENIMVYDLVGSCICIINGKESAMKIPVSSLNITQPGVYVVSVETTTGTTTKKVFVK